jgi:hypothetical protein
MTETEVSNLGFKRLSGSEVLYSKMVKCKSLPPFYIRVDKALHNDTDWRVLRDGHFVTIVNSVEQLKLTIEVLTVFERDTFTS